MRYILHIALVAVFTVITSANSQELPEWTDPKPLNTNAEVDSRSDREQRVILDSQGNGVAVWPGGTRGQTVLYATYAVESDSWSSPTWIYTHNQSDIQGDSSVSLATDNQGTWIAVWTSQYGINNTSDLSNYILYSLYDFENDEWSTPSHVAPDTGSVIGYHHFPNIVSAGQGIWMATWTTLDYNVANDENISYSLFDIDTGQWSTTKPLNSDTTTNRGDDSDIRVATDGHGELLAVWRNYRRFFGGAEEFKISYATFDAGLDSWSVPKTLAQMSGRGFSPEVSTDGLGNWISVWTSDEPMDNVLQDVRYATYDVPNDTWSSSMPLNTDSELAQSSFEDRPHIAADDQGNWMAVWSSENRSAEIVDFDEVILFSMYDVQTDSWTAPNPVNNDFDGDVVRNRSPRVATDGNGNWLISWAAINTRYYDGDSDLFYARTPKTSFGGSGSGSVCFIATAAYGTPLAGEITVLREFRDARLLNNGVGTAFVDTYYRLSPPLAGIVSRYPAVANLVRTALAPLIAIISIGSSALVSISLGAALLFGMHLRRRGAYRLKTNSTQ
ncbi:MAG: CFI-box-CTERM domain-containing protein [Candidatus Hydrogenedentota bacterium]